MNRDTESEMDSLPSIDIPNLSENESQDSISQRPAKRKIIFFLYFITFLVLFLIIMIFLILRPHKSNKKIPKEDLPSTIIKSVFVNANIVEVYLNCLSECGCVLANKNFPAQEKYDPWEIQGRNGLQTKVMKNHSGEDITSISFRANFFNQYKLFCTSKITSNKERTIEVSEKYPYSINCYKSGESILKKFELKEAENLKKINKSSKTPIPKVPLKKYVSNQSRIKNISLKVKNEFLTLKGLYPKSLSLICNLELKEEIRNIENEETYFNVTENKVDLENFEALKKTSGNCQAEYITSDYAVDNVSSKPVAFEVLLTLKSSGNYHLKCGTFKKIPEADEDSEVVLVEKVLDLDIIYLKNNKDENVDIKELLEEYGFKIIKKSFSNKKIEKQLEESFGKEGIKLLKGLSKLVKLPMKDLFLENINCYETIYKIIEYILGKKSDGKELISLLEVLLTYIFRKNHNIDRFRYQQDGLNLITESCKKLSCEDVIKKFIGRDK